MNKIKSISTSAERLLRALSYRLPAVVLCSLLLACTAVLPPLKDQEIVVEGWIEQGQWPVVILTTTVPVTTEKQDLDDLEKYLIKWAKVTISDGEKDYVLYGTKDDRYFPPYIYTTQKFTGEVGKTYHLKVEYSGKTATAKTTIPAVPQLENITIREAGDKDKWNIFADIVDCPQTKDNYKLFIRKEKKDSCFKASMFGILDDSTMEGDRMTVQVTDCLNHYLTRYHSWFESTDVVHIRLSNMEDALFDYWRDYEAVTSLSKNPILPVSMKIRSNVDGALGYWAGYGSSWYKVDFNELLNRDNDSPDQEI